MILVVTGAAGRTHRWLPFPQGNPGPAGQPTRIASSSSKGGAWLLRLLLEPKEGAALLLGAG